MVDVDLTGAHDERILAAALRCIARWGTAKTTLDDIAREAGLSRATVYRVFPGGKDALFVALAQAEISGFFAGVAARLEAADTLEELVVSGMVEAGRRFRDHEALQFLLAYEPETVVPHLAFTQMDQVLRIASAFAAPYLARFLDPARAELAAEWIVRILLSYTSSPSPTVDPADEDDIRSLVRSFVLPALEPDQIQTTP